MCATNGPVFMVGQASRVPSALLPAPSRRSSFSNPFLHENPRREGVAGLRRGERAAQGRGDCIGRVLSGFGVRVRGASVRAGPRCCAPGARSALGGSLMRERHTHFFFFRPRIFTVFFRVHDSVEQQYVYFSQVKCER